VGKEWQLLGCYIILTKEKNKDIRVCEITLSYTKILYIEEIYQRDQ